MNNESVVLPDYGGGSFGDLPKTVHHLLTGQGTPGLSGQILGKVQKRWDKVALFFVDAFGWSFCQPRLHSDPFLRQFVDTGVAECITSQFPSTTAAHVTCIHTGMTPIESGVYEWQYYEPHVDKIIVPLLFSSAGDRRRNTLESVEPDEILPNQTIYRDLEDFGVSSYAFQPSVHLASPYARLTYDGAEVIPYRTLSEGLISFHHCLVNEPNPAYFFFYFDGIDQVGHSQGPDSRHVALEIDTFLALMQNVLGSNGDGRTLLMIVADHGMTAIDPKRTMYLNIEPDFEGVERFLSRNRAGQLLIPAGSCRDMFLYIKDGMIEEAHAFLEMRLNGRARVLRCKELIEQGMFGVGSINESFVERVGDLVILPNDGESVWWYERGKFEQTLYGGHGGLSAREMQIPFLARPY